MKRLSFFRTHSLPLVIITAVVAILAFVNYTPGTWLSGWDNLHPEFNFALNIGRSLSAVWQEYQGVGLLGGMSHAADLPRQFFLLAASVVFSPQILRYLWVWITWWCGAVGAYFLAILIFQSRSRDTVQTSLAPIQVASLIAGLSYLLNLATVQYYYVPYESFSSFFGGLPWLLWAVLRYYKLPSVKRLAVLFVVSVLASSAFYVQTLFVVFGLLLGVITLAQLVVKKISLKHALIAGLVLISSNMFWFLPSMYFTLTSSNVTVESKVNRLSTYESQLMNQSYGTPLNIALLKGYWFGYQDFESGKYTYLIPEWRNHADTASVVGIGIGLWVLAFIGICFSVRRDDGWHFEWLAAFLVVTLMLTSGNGPLGILFSWASKNIPLFGQIFRTAFTKWSVAAALIYALGLSSFSYWILSKAKRVQRIVSGLWLFVIAVCLVWSVWPAFQGRLISPLMRLEQPSAYQELFNFFNTQPKQTRVVTLPLPDFWAWSFYSWNYRGSGFLWYGIEQPILDRNFDVWSSSNETFYNELSTAFRAQDPTAFVQMLQKYDVSYALLDESIISPNKDALPNQVTQLKQMLEDIGAKEVWSKDFLSVYKLPIGTSQFVSAPAQYTTVWQEQTYTRIDPAYRELGSYISHPELQATVVFPFAQLSREKLASAPELNNRIRIETPLPNLSQPSQVILPAVATGSAYPVQVQLRRNEQNLELNFTEAGMIQVAGQTRPLPQLPQLEVPMEEKLTDDSFGSININGQTIELATNSAQVTGWVTLRANSPISLFGKFTTGEYTEQVEMQVPSEFWANLSRPDVVNIPAGQHSIQLEIPTSWTNIPFADLLSQNCEVFKRGTYSVTKRGQSTNYLASDYASICTGTTIPLLNTKMSGLLRLNGENIEGRSLKFYVTNGSAQRADLEELSSAGSFSDTYTLLEWPNLPAQIYGINWETRSFGGESENRLDSIQVMPLNLTRLINTKVVNNPTGIATPTTNEVKLSNNWKIGTYQYGTLAKNSAESGIVTLLQGYHSGWTAFALPLNSASILDAKILDHVTYNGWANGWIVPKGEYQIVMIFWPQLLGFVGNAVLIGLVFFFALSLRNKKI